MTLLTLGSERERNRMTIALLLSSLLGGLVGAGLGLYWDTSAVMVVLYYVLGSMAFTITSVTVVMSRMEKQNTPVQDSASKVSPQFNG